MGAVSLQHVDDYIHSLYTNSRGSHRLEVLETGSLALLKSHRYVFLQLGCCVSLTEETYYQKSFKLVKHLTANEVNE